MSVSDPCLCRIHVCVGSMLMVDVQSHRYTSLTRRGKFGDDPFLFQHDCTPVHKARFIKTWMSEFGVEELDWPAQSPDLNAIEHLWDELERRLRARPSRPTSVPDLTNALLEERPQAVRMGRHVSASLTLSIGAPQGCVLSPLLYSLYTYDCVATTNSTTIIIKFPDDTVVVGLISDNNEEIRNLENWCQRNNLLLNVSKTKELIVDFSTKQERNYQTPVINESPVERVDSFRYLGVHITQDLSWSCHIDTMVKKARQHLYHLRRLRDFRLPSKRTWSEAKSDTCAGQEDSERGKKESKDHHQGHPDESGLCWWQHLKADSPTDTAHRWVPRTQTKEDTTSPDKAHKARLDLPMLIWTKKKTSGLLFYGADGGKEGGRVGFSPGMQKDFERKGEDTQGGGGGGGGGRGRGGGIVSCRVH
ncbi:hypothetical protein QTP70_011542 [Hemibagrus guttatus]|uniref:Reverse transcriptase domain-containing protein n=1 Tax=Hemibagrus guttatus TaxID=175788 RepID=A0AAE0UMU6_9TELE|nr:hypothetical protein QTP70_011542 [Hemibagrus guttatus]